MKIIKTGLKSALADIGCLAFWAAVIPSVLTVGGCAQTTTDMRHGNRTMSTLGQDITVENVVADFEEYDPETGNKISTSHIEATGYQSEIAEVVAAVLSNLLAAYKLVPITP